MAQRAYFTIEIQGAEAALAQVVRLDLEMKELAKDIKAANKAGDMDNVKIGTTNMERLKTSMKEARQELRDSVKDFKANPYDATSLIGMRNEYSKLTREIELMSEAERKSAEGRRKIEAASNLSGSIRTTDKSIGNFKSSIGNYRDAASDLLNNATGGLSGSLAAGGGVAIAATATAVAAGTAALFKLNKDFSDVKADIAKTTGFTASEVNKVVDNLKALDTRTSLNNLAKIAIVAGQLGVKGVDGVTAFTKSLEVLDVALGNEFKGGTEEVATEIGKLSTVLFGITDDGEVLAKRMLGIGNALNFLAASGNATSPVITDFAQRMGGVLAPLDVTAGQILGLSAAMEELAISPERGATAISLSIKSMGANIEQFSRVLGVSQESLSKAFNTNPLDAFLKVIELVNKKAGGDKTSMLTILNDLRIRGSGVSEVFFKFGKNMGLVADRVGDATLQLDKQGSVMAEYALKQENLAGSWERLKNSMSEFFVNSGVEAFFTKLVGGAADAVKSLTESISLKGFADIQKAKDADKAKTEANKPEILKLYEQKQISELFGIEARLEKFSEARLARRRKELELQGLTNEQIEAQLILDTRAEKVAKDTTKTQEEKNRLSEAAAKAAEDAGGKYVSEEEKKRQYNIEKLKETNRRKEEKREKDRLEAAKNVEEAEQRIAKLRADAVANPFDREEASLRAKAKAASEEAARPKLGVTQDQIVTEQRLIQEALLKDLEELNKKRLDAHREYQEELEDLQRENDTRLLEINESTYKQHYEDLKLSRDKEIEALETSYEAEQHALDTQRAKGLITEKKYGELSLEAQKAYSEKVIAADAKSKEELAQAAEAHYESQKVLLERQSDNEIETIKRNAEAQRRVIDNDKSLTFFEQGNKISAIDRDEESQIQAAQLAHLNKVKDLEALIAAIRSGANKETIEFLAKRVAVTDKQAEKETEEREKVNEALKEGAIELGRQISDALFEDKKRQIEEEKEFALEALNTQLDAELELVSGNTTLQKALKKQYELDKREIERKAFEQNKQVKIQEATANASLAIIQAFASTPFPFSLIASALIATKTAFEITNIKKTKFFAKGGFTSALGIGTDETGEEVAGVVHAGEYVAPKHQVRKYRRLFDALDNDRRKFADGGFTSGFAPAQVGVSEVRFSNAQMAELSSSVYSAAKEGTKVGSKDGIYLGAAESKRLKEREDALQTNTSF